MNDVILQNVSKSFDSQNVLDNFSYIFKKGTITCIEGESGCGKTTLLNIIAGLVKPDSGTVSGKPESIAFVFQEDRLCEDFSAYGNVKLVCGKKISKSEITAHFKELNLADDMNKRVSEFSGGMKRRVCLAMAICSNADCILLDEPFKGLDEKTKESAMDYVLKYASGKTVICVTHDNTETEYLGGKSLILKKEKTVN